MRSLRLLALLLLLALVIWAFAYPNTNITAVAANSVTGTNPTRMAN